MSRPIRDDTFDLIVDKNNIDEAYKKTLKGKGKYDPEAMEFAIDEVYNLLQLRQSLIDETYEFGGYISFWVYEPKKRRVDAPHHKDKIVQLAINNVLKKVYYPSFIHDSYACMEKKGTHKCADRLSHFLRKARWEYGEDAYIVKIDVKKFFYTIDREILKELLPKKIKCEKTLRLLFKIIDSADELDLLGMPLGNTLSQLSANIYMNELDQFCKRRLSIKYYIRYMDDVIIIVKNKEEATWVMGVAETFIREELHLNINLDKTKNFPLAQGANAIGFKSFATHRLLRNESKKRIKRKIKAMPELILSGQLTVRKAEQMLNSWKGHAKHADSHNFIQSLLDRFDFLYLNKKGRIKIDVKKLEGMKKINESS